MGGCSGLAPEKWWMICRQCQLVYCLGWWEVDEEEVVVAAASDAVVGS